MYFHIRKPNHVVLLCNGACCQKKSNRKAAQRKGEGWVRVTCDHLISTKLNSGLFVPNVFIASILGMKTFTFDVCWTVHFVITEELKTN